MQDPNEFLLSAHQRAVAFKNERVAESGADAPVPFIVVANRGSQHVATFLPEGRDPASSVLASRNTDPHRRERT